MNEFSKEIIEIGGKEYSLFLNRKGIVAWEKYRKAEQDLWEEHQSNYAKLIENQENYEEITSETNPFEGLDEFDNISEDKKIMTKIYKKLYWIMLYTEYKLSLEEVSKLYDDACEEYGEEQVIALAVQMVNDANDNLVNKDKQLKNLKALRPSKN